jgi:hypothetical protein
VLKQKRKFWTKFAALWVFCELAGGVAAAAPLLADVRAGWRYDDNLNRAETDNQQEDDGIFTLEGRIGTRIPVSEHAQLTARLGLLTDIHADIDDLNALAPTARIDLMFQPASGFTAPWYAVSAAVGYREHADSDIRDGANWTLGLIAGKRFTDRISARAGYRYLGREGELSEVFDLEQHELSVHGDYRISRVLSAYATYAYLTGDLTSVSRNRKFPPVATALWPDPAFGFNAWRLDGHTHSLTLGMRVELSRSTGLDARVRYSKANADGDNRWSNYTAGVALSHRF